MSFSIDTKKIKHKPKLRGDSKLSMLLPEMTLHSSSCGAKKRIQIVPFHDKGFATLYLINGGDILLEHCVWKKHLLPIGLQFIRQTEENGAFLFTVHKGFEFSACKLAIMGEEMYEMGEILVSNSYTELYKRVAGLQLKGTPRMFLKGEFQLEIKRQMLEAGFAVATAPEQVQRLFQENASAITSCNAKRPRLCMENDDAAVGALLKMLGNST